MWLLLLGLDQLSKLVVQFNFANVSFNHHGFGFQPVLNRDKASIYNLFFNWR